MRFGVRLNEMYKGVFRRLDNDCRVATICLIICLNEYVISIIVWFNKCYWASFNQMPSANRVPIRICSNIAKFIPLVIQ